MAATTKAHDFAFPTDTDNTGGLSIREYYAGLAMQGLLANPVACQIIAERTAGTIEQVQELAWMSVVHADALIVELNKPTRLEAAVDQATDKLNEMVKP